MTTTRRGRRGRRGSARVKTTWENSALTFPLLTAGVVVFADITPHPLQAHDTTEEHGTATVLRSIISVDVAQLAPQVNTPQNYALAMYVGTAANVVGANILQPLANENQDWYYWTARSTFREGEERQQSFEADIRSRRRLRGGYHLVMVGQPDSANASNITLTVGLRQLWAISN